MQTEHGGGSATNGAAPFTPSWRSTTCLHSEFCILNLRDLSHRGEEHGVLNLDEGRAGLCGFDFVSGQRGEQLAARLLRGGGRFLDGSLDGAAPPTPLGRG